jgi:hypothetical protein
MGDFLPPHNRGADSEEGGIPGFVEICGSSRGRGGRVPEDHEVRMGGYAPDPNKRYTGNGTKMYEY